MRKRTWIAERVLKYAPKLAEAIAQAVRRKKAAADTSRLVQMPTRKPYGKQIRPGI